MTLFKASLDKFKEAGFSLLDPSNETDFFESWKQMMAYHSDPIESMYITLGGETSMKPYLNYSNDCWHFDVEAIEGEGSYVRILENLKRISKNDLNFQNIKDYCNDNEDNKAWVSFDFEGSKYKWDLKVDDDWADGQLFDNIQELCKKHNKNGKLTFFPEGQAFVTSYLNKEQFTQVRNELGLKIDWLKVKGQIY
jgi:hypothetical protein